MFQKTLKYKDAINLCYGRQEIQELQGCVLDTHAWAICKVVVETIHPIVKFCIFKQTWGYYLLSNALNDAFSINVCIQNEIQQSMVTLFNLVKGGFDYELGALWMHIIAKI